MHNYRDAALLMSCDRGVQLLAQHLGWTHDLETLIAAYDRQNAHLVNAPASPSSSSSATVAATSSSSSSAASAADNLTSASSSSAADDDAALAKPWRRALRLGEPTGAPSGALPEGEMDRVVSAALK